MGVALCLAPCLVCKKTFSFNPVRVPSFKVDGVKEPICEPCMQFINKQREEQGIEQFTWADDAYTACDENELI